MQDVKEKKNNRKFKTLKFLATLQHPAYDVSTHEINREIYLVYHQHFTVVSLEP